MCYTPGQLRQETRDALKTHALHRTEICFVRIDPTDPYAYGKRLAEEWHRQRSFALCEPDIVYREDVVDAFLDCPEGYCAYPYELATDCMPALGCTRFRASFLRKYPDAMEETLRRRVGFRQLDVTLQRAILVREHGEQPHVHLPKVEHLNPEKSPLRPDANPEPLMTLPAW